MAAVAYQEPGKIPAGIMALLVHALFFGFLLFGFSWQTKQPEKMEVEIWSSLPPSTEPAPSPPVPEVKPPPPPPPKPVEEAVREIPKPEPVVKPDIALKEKPDKLKKEEVKKQEMEKRKAEEEKVQLAKAQEGEALRQEQERINRELQARRAAEQASLIGEHKGRILAKIKRFIVIPPDVKGNPEAEYDVIMLPSGDVLGVKLKRSSNHAAYDAAVERAIYKAQPLPLPPDPALFKEFRDLNLKFRPVE